MKKKKPQQEKCWHKGPFLIIYWDFLNCLPHGDPLEEGRMEGEAKQFQNPMDLKTIAYEMPCYAVSKNETPR